MGRIAMGTIRYGALAKASSERCRTQGNPFADVTLEHRAGRGQGLRPSSFVLQEIINETLPFGVRSDGGPRLCRPAGARADHALRHAGDAAGGDAPAANAGGNAKPR